MISDEMKEQFGIMVKAIKADTFALAECKDKETGEVVSLVCLAAVIDGELHLTPVAEMLDGNPFERFSPPTPGGGFDDGSDKDPRYH